MERYFKFSETADVLQLYISVSDGSKYAIPGIFCLV